MSTMIDVALVTWPNHPERIGYFRRTVEAMAEHLTASAHGLRFVCSSETERDPNVRWFGHELVDICMAHGITLSWRNEPANLGANMNAALRMCEAKAIFLVQDDWLLTKPLDLSPGAALLESDRNVDLLRYSYPDIDSMRPTFYERPDGWRTIDLAGHWPYGDDPHLRRKDFMEKWGWYKEGGRHGSASGNLLRDLVRCRANICTADSCYFLHIGDVTAVVNDIRVRRIQR